MEAESQTHSYKREGDFDLLAVILERERKKKKVKSVYFMHSILSTLLFYFSYIYCQLIDFFTDQVLNSTEHANFSRQW